ncbi:MAG: hypothetical protein ACI4SD_01160 [Suilimivivens sp.]
MRAVISKKKLEKKICTVMLSIVLILTLAVWNRPLEIKAAGFNNSISDFELYSSGCLKSMKITIDADGVYATAYGKIAIHTQPSRYGWNNRWTYDGSSAWPSTITDDGFVTWGAGNEFLWSDGNPHEITVEFDDGVVNLNSQNTYYVYLWTRATSYGIYPDALVYTLKTQGGKLEDSSGNTLVQADTHTHQWHYEAADNQISAWCTQTSSSDQCTYQGQEKAIRFTLTASDMIHSGEPYGNAEKTDNITTVTGAVCSGIIYYNVDAEGNIIGEALSSAPTEVGKYVATVTIEGQTAKAYFEIKAQTYNITVSDDGNGTASADRTDAEAGTEITLMPNANSGYHFKEWQVISGGVTISDNKFVMPEGSVEIKAAFEKDEEVHSHSWSVTWYNDDTFHWHECEGEGICDIVENSSKFGYRIHIYDDEADTTCNDCGYIRTVDSEDVGNGDVTNDTEVEKNACEAELGGDLKNTVLDSDDNAALETGKNVSVWLEVKNVSESVDETEKDLVQQEAGKATVAMYLDLTLWKQVEGESPKTVSNTNGNVTVTFIVPGEYINNDSSVERIYQIIRIHDGVVTTIGCDFNKRTGEASFTTDKFSTYALAYVDSAKTAGDDKKEEKVEEEVYCTHKFEYSVLQEGTVSQDGLMGMQCIWCGAVEQNTIERIPAYLIFNKVCEQEIRKATGTELTIETDIWESFQKRVLEALSEKPQLNLTINYTYKHKKYTVTIPAGTDVMTLLNEEGFCGFRYLDQMFAGKEIVPEHVKKDEITQ